MKGTHYRRRAYCYTKPAQWWLGDDQVIFIRATVCRLPRSHHRKGHYRNQDGKQVYVQPCIVAKENK